METSLGISRVGKEGAESTDSTARTLVYFETYLARGDKAACPGHLLCLLRLSLPTRWQADNADLARMPRASPVSHS